MIPSLKVHIYIYIRLCTAAAINSAAHRSCKLTRLYLPSLSCLVLSVMSNIDTVLMYRVPSFLFRLVYIHSANDLLKNRGRLYTPAKWAQQTRRTHSCIGFTDADAQSKHRCHESAFDDQSSWCRRPSHVNHRINNLFVSLLPAQSSWKSVSAILQQSTLGWWIYFFNGFHGILFSVALNNTTIWLPKQRSLNVNQHAWRADLMAVLRYERFLERIEEFGKHTWKIVDSWCRLV